MPMAFAVGGSALLGAGSSIFGGKSQRRAANQAAQAQLQAAREAIAAQQQGAERGFDIFQDEAQNARDFLEQQNKIARQDLEPLRRIGVRNLERAEGLTDPNSLESQAERDVFQRQLEQNLSARGLTASGTELAGLRDYETQLARERRNLVLGLAGQGANTLQSLSSGASGLGQNLAGISQNLGATGTNLFGGLGQNVGNTLQQGAMGAAQSQLQGALAATQGFQGAGNAIQGAAQNLIALQNQRNQQDLLNSYLGGGNNNLLSLSRRSNTMPLDTYMNVIGK